MHTYRRAGPVSSPCTTTDGHDVSAAHDEAEEHIRPGLMLEAATTALQLFMLLMCMFQALVLTMLARQALLQYGLFGGAALLVALWTPTTLMSTLVTPHVIKNLAIAFSTAHAQHDVLDEMLREFEQASLPGMHACMRDAPRV